MENSKSSSICIGGYIVIKENLIRFGICLTYKCNLSCPGCNRYLDVAKWQDSDITLEDLEEGHKRVVKAGIKIIKVRVTGGEPLLHPRFEEAMVLIGKTWNKDYRARTCVFSNGKIKLPKGRGWRYRTSSKKAKKAEWFRPSRVSPADLGLSVVRGVEGNCDIQNGCGRLFDAFGFAPCIFSAPIGRLLGIDPYTATPELRGNPEICKHCLYSMGRKSMWKLIVEIRKSDSPPTKTYQKAIEKAKNGSKMIEFTRFEDR